MVSATTMIGRRRMWASAKTWTSSRLSYKAETELLSSLLPAAEERPISGSGSRCRLPFPVSEARPISTSSVGDDEREQALMERRDRRLADLKQKYYKVVIWILDVWSDIHICQHNHKMWPEYFTSISFTPKENFNNLFWVLAVYWHFMFFSVGTCKSAFFTIYYL